MKKTVIILIASVAFAFCAEAQTAQKLATVNIRLLFDGYFKTKQADNEIKARAREFDAEGKKYQDEYKSLTEKYNAALAKVDDPTITAETKALRKAEAEETLMEIKNIEAAITQFERSARTALLEQQRRHRTNIIKEITELVAKRAQSGGYSMVFDVGADSADRTKILVYTDGKDDLTQDILKQLNANAPADILKQMEESPITSTLNVTDQ